MYVFTHVSEMLLFSCPISSILELLINFIIYFTENSSIGSLPKNNTDIDSIVPFRSQQPEHVTIIEVIINGLSFSLSA